MKINILIITLSLIISVINEDREIIYISDGMSMISDFDKSKTYLFILQVERPDRGVLTFTYFEEYYKNYPKMIDIYEYSNENYSDYNFKIFDTPYWDFQTGKTVTKYSHKPWHSTTIDLGFEIKFSEDVKNVKVEGYIDKDLTIFIIVFIFISIKICITIFIAICCCCKKPKKINEQAPLNQPFIDKNQHPPQYYQNNNIPNKNNQYNNNQNNNILKIIIHY